MNLKNTVVFLVLLLAGMILGSLLGKVLGPWIPFLGISETITWHPSGDFAIVKYDFFFQLQLNLASLIGIALAFWLYRKLS